MSKVCAICGKTYQKATRYKKIRSVYNPVSRRQQKPNLQWFKMPDGQRILVCSACRKRLSKTV